MAREYDLFRETVTVPSFKHTVAPKYLEYFSDEAIKAVMCPPSDPIDNLSSIKGFIQSLKSLIHLLK